MLRGTPPGGHPVHRARCRAVAVRWRVDARYTAGRVVRTRRPHRGAVLRGAALRRHIYLPGPALLLPSRQPDSFVIARRGTLSSRSARRLSARGYETPGFFFLMIPRPPRVL